MMLAILLISCNDDNDHDGLAPAELSGTYSNKLSAPANGDSLILSYNGNTFIGKDAEFKTDDGKTAHIILKYVLPHDKETTIAGVSLTASPGSYSFSGDATASNARRFITRATYRPEGWRWNCRTHDSGKPADGERDLACRT